MRAEAARAVPLDERNELDDLALVERARSRDGSAFRLIMQRNNRRLYRVAFGVLGDDAEAEDVVQEAYVRAFVHLETFRGDARISTWLTRIVLNEALGRIRQRRPTVDLDTLETMHDQSDPRVIFLPSALRDGGPEAAAARAEMRHLLEHAVAGLPEPFRVVFLMREVEQLSVEETAADLGLRPETVKTRLHRARRLLRQGLETSLASALVGTFPFEGARCARMTTAVLERIGLPEP